MCSQNDAIPEAEPLSCAPSSSERPPSPNSRIPLRILRRLKVRSWVYELLYESRSFVRCIRTLIKLRTVPLCDLGPEYGLDASGHLLICSRTRGRRQDIRSFQSSDYRSPKDLENFLAGWYAGATWGDHTPHSCRPNTDNHQLPCMVPKRSRTV
jgi:hypothetical protein